MCKYKITFALYDVRNRFGFCMEVNNALSSHFVYEISNISVEDQANAEFYFKRDS